MISLSLADLVVIAGEAQGLDPAIVLELMDVEAARAALAEARAPQDRIEAHAAALLGGLLRHRPLRKGNDQVALLATLQFLGLNGWDLDLGSPEEIARLIEHLRAGTVDQPDLEARICEGLRWRDAGAGCRKPAPSETRSGWKRWSARKGVTMFERFTKRARQVVVYAQEEARELGHDFIGTEHLLLGLIREGEGISAQALQRLGVSLDAVRAGIEAVIGRGAGAPRGHIPFTPRAKKVMELSLREALKLGHRYVGTEHILLGLIREGEGVGAEVLMRAGVGLAQARETIVTLLSGPVADPPGEGQSRTA